MKFFEEGRQNGTYFKCTLAQNRIFDLHILKFPVGAHIERHKDEMPSYEHARHHRMNIVLKRAKAGGDFYTWQYQGRMVSQQTPYETITRGGHWHGTCSKKRVNIFRPDEVTHSVTPVTEGTRYVLSFGWASRATDGGRIFKFFEWLGLVRKVDGKLRLPFHLPPMHVFKIHLKQGKPFDRFYTFRNLPGVRKWDKGRILPRRWGFGVCGIEFGDRG